MSQEIVTEHTLEGYFAELVDEALRKERLEFDEATQCYLVQLVSEFGQSAALHAAGPGDEKGTPALFRLYERALNCSPRERFAAYRHLGDVALIVSSFFTPHIERSLVSVDYYVQMGGSAYHRASIVDRTGAFAPLMSGLARSFNRLVEVLSRVAESTTLPIARDVAALFERFVRNPDDKALANRLLVTGAVPILGGGSA